MNGQMEEVVNVLTSCLLTSKNGSSLHGLQKDYRLLEGRNIPYQALGFPTVEAFLQKVPNVRLLKRGGEMWAEAIPTSKQAHIAELVADQRQARTRRRGPRFRPMSMHRTNSSRNHRPFFPSQTRNGSSWNSGSMSNNRGSSNYSTSHSSARPSTQPVHQPLMSVATVPPRNLGSNGTNSNKPTLPNSRIPERKIQPDQYLDYAPDRRPAPGTLKRFDQLTIEKPASIDKSEPPPISRPPSVTPTNTAPVSAPRTEPAPRVEPAPRNEPTTPPIVSAAPKSVPVAPKSVPVAPNSVPVAPKPVPVAPNSVPVAPKSVPVAPPSVPSPVQPTLSRQRMCDRLNILKSNQIQSNSTVTNENNVIQVTFTTNNAGGGGSLPVRPIWSSSDPREELRVLVEKLHLPEPVYKTRLMGKVGHNSGVVGQVSIDSYKFSSYPREAGTVEAAEILAARQAIDELEKEHKLKSAFPPTEDRTLLKQRILLIVDRHNGVFVHKISAYYQELYVESLPDNWFEDVEKWPEVVMEKGVEKSILRRQSPHDERIISPKIDRTFSYPIGKVEPRKLVLPAEREWVACVLSVVSSTEVWVRLYGDNYSEKLDALSSEMNDYYDSVLLPIVEDIEIGGYYALKENDLWHRVKVLDKDELTGEADIFFIDLGDEDTATASQLLPLDRKFCQLAGQAMRIALSGLEYFSDCTWIQPRMAEFLIDSIFWVHELSREDTEFGPFATVILYDTNGPTEVEMNKFLSKKIFRQLMMDIPQLVDEGRVPEVHVSHVEENGDVFVQLKNDRMSFLTKNLENLTANGFTPDEMERFAIREIDHSRMYLAKCPTSGGWNRARIFEASGEATLTLRVFFIDSGRAVNVEAKNILQLDSLSKFLSMYPAQAVRVRLNNVDRSMFDKKLIARLVELAPSNESCLVKIIESSRRGSPPTVQLFKRTGPDNRLVAINDTLSIERQLSQTNGDGNNNVKPRKRLERVLSRVSSNPDDAKTIKPPTISDIGDFFEIFVTMAANPNNFTVRPLSLTIPLQAMMAKLQESCATNVAPCLTLNSIREGRFYAAKHPDTRWYRVWVLNIIDERTVSVYFCDFGDVMMIDLDELQPLQKQFYDLPYMAIKARLVGVQPTNMDWAVEDVVRFQDLVVEKALCSVVVDSVLEKDSPGGKVLSLQLIDVSTPEDINIGDLLVEEGRAIHASF